MKRIIGLIGAVLVGMTLVSACNNPCNQPTNICTTSSDKVGSDGKTTTINSPPGCIVWGGC